MKLNFSLVLILLILFCCQNEKAEFICKPCDLPCDELVFSKLGTCPHCHMKLINRSELKSNEELTVNKINIQNGSGKFLIEGGFQKKNTIVIHYYKPKNFTSESSIVFVLPGAGRNGDDYRDAWIEKSEKYNVLVLSPEYPEKYYPEFWSYNLAGMIKNVMINEERTAMISFKITHDPDEWLFKDFDRIFNLVKEELQFKRNSYDMFGHSAGGQMLHRLAIFNPKNKANRILASNSGWYTVPTDNVEFPYGLKGSNISLENIDFSKKLIVFLGEMDNADENRGDLRHTLEMDKQGLHRLERGKYFYNKAKTYAKKLNSDFNWKLEIIPNIGHDYKGMSKAAADFLYKTE